MNTYISLLKSINVGGKNKLPMTALRDIYQVLGCTNVTTYIQSGNVIFRAANNTKTLENGVSQILYRQWGYTIPVWIRKVHFFSRIITNNPFEGFEPSTLYVTLLGDATQQTQIPNMTEQAWGGDRFVAQGSVVYVHCPHGYGRTKLNNSFFESRGHTRATTRNWKTICRLVELATTQYE